MPDETSLALTPAVAAKFARLALAHVTREYPNKMDHVMNGPADVLGPRTAHPIFYGSFDWHSCVHGYWLLATVRRLFPESPECKAIAALMDGHLTEANVAAEIAYLAPPNRGTFERPYGWAWVLMLSAELSRHETSEGRRWHQRVAPLAAAFAERLKSYLVRATYPIRVGTHFNTAFALALASEYADATDDLSLRSLLRHSAERWFAGDADAQAWEPGGDDFLSSTLIEAECMRRMLEPRAFDSWFTRFLPRVDRREPATLFVPATVSDRSDGKIGHLDGLNLTRAWCWRTISATWPADDVRREIAMRAAEEHLMASLPHVAGEYAGEHWLATFALLALMARAD